MTVYHRERFNKREIAKKENIKGENENDDEDATKTYIGNMAVRQNIFLRARKHTHALKRCGEVYTNIEFKKVFFVQSK